MKLFIDISDSDALRLEVGGVKWRGKARNNKSQILLCKIDELIKKQNKTVRDVTEIEVNTAPGSFTGIRVGVSVAQALGWSLDVRVNGKDVSKESLDIKYLKI